MPLVYVPSPDEERIVYPAPLWLLLVKYTFYALMIPIWIAIALVFLVVYFLLVLFGFHTRSRRRHRA